jgi:gliding motility-associated-like protein
MKKFALFILLFTAFFAKASHISGGQITYNCLGNNVYEVKLTYFWDCQGGFNPGATQSINVDGCGTSLFMTVTQSTLTPGDGIPADGLCPNSGLAVCKKRIEYIGTITLPSACNSWTFSIGSCCRGGNITNITGGTGASYYHFATVNTVDAPCNNSPDISIGTLPNFCANQPACFNLGATEVDGNTLSYAFIAAYESGTTFVTYAAGYTGPAPMTGITINPTTGQINFTPTLQGDFVITVQITEKDALGNIIGTIMRDFQVIVTNCSNQTVACGQGAITNVTSGTVPGGNGNTLQICENIPFCFDVTFTDPNIGDSVKLSSPNMATTLPGSSMVLTYTPGIKNQVKATICWTPPQGSSGLNTSFVLIVKDNACPVPGTQIINYFIDVLPATSAGPDRTICGPQAASITATGSSTVFAWSDLAGNPVPVGPAFSCNPCNNPVIKPAVTSTYVVTNIGGGVNCKNKDTIVVNVVPDFTLTANVATTSGCLNSAVQFTSSVNPAGPGYSYTWSPSAPLTSTNTANTSAIYSTPGIYNYTLTAMNTQGCTKQSANIAFTANPVVTPQFTVVPTNTIVCANGSVPLSVNFGSSPPTTCGLALSGCAVSNTFQIGNGASTNGASSFPTPYSNYYESSRMQFLYTAAELLAGGLVPGKISRLGYNVITLNSFGAALQSFSIKMKCTSVSSLSAFDDNGLNQVFSSPAYFPTTGWNTHNLTQSYEWDGISNILVDICYDVLPGSWISSGSTGCAYTTTSFGSVVYSNADSQNQCGVTSSFPNTSSNRPNTRFGNCSSTPPASSFSYSWSPAMGLSSTSVPNPTANISSSVEYTVVVTPTAAATCSNVGTTSLTVILPVTPTINPVGPLCTNASTVQLSTSQAGGTWSLTAATTTAGVFTPSLAAVGNNTVTYLYGGAGCSQTVTAVIPIEQFVPATISGTINPICLPSGTINLSTALPTSTLGAGVWSGPGITGTTFDPNVAGIGTHTLTYNTNSVPTTALCPATGTIEVQLNSVAQPTIPVMGPYCTNAGSFSLSPIPTGGTWTGTGISSTGIVTPSLAMVGNNTYTYSIGSLGCSNSNTTTISIEQYVPSTITGAIPTLCTTSPTVDLSTALGTSTLGTGVWSGTGVTGTIFDPAVAGGAVHTLTYSTNSVPTAALCPDASTVNITVNSQAQPTITAAGPYCDNYAAQTMTVSSTGGVWSAVTPGSIIDPTTGSFSPSSSIVGNNTLLYTLTNGPCVNTETISVNVIHFVPATITNTVGPYCIYDAATNLQTLEQFPGGVWSGPGVSGSMFTPSAAGANTHVITYSTNPSPLLNCGNSNTIAITVNAKPEANASPSVMEGCNPVTVNYQTTSYATGTAVWDFGDGTARDTGLFINHIYTIPGTYTATLYYTDNIGCKDTTMASSDVTSHPMPIASFDPSVTETTVVDGQVEFTNHSTVLTNNTYTWDIGGLYYSTTTNESYLFVNSGNFVVTLVATSAEGCVDDTSLVIVVNPDVVLYVPNAFTPGSDNLNDAFQIFLPPTGVDYSTFSLMIYDRWGELIYKTNDVNESWNGSKNNSGETLKQDTYVYKIYFKDEKKKSYEKMGHVTLLRK